jgi:hypothetical protein
MVEISGVPFEETVFRRNSQAARIDDKEAVIEQMAAAMVSTAANGKSHRSNDPKTAALALSARTHRS